MTLRFVRNDGFCDFHATLSKFCLILYENVLEGVYNVRRLVFPTIFHGAEIMLPSRFARLVVLLFLFVAFGAAGIVATETEKPVRRDRESLGSLVAKIDGRDTPLALGYHKVSVEIRDQIARTTIEESFINRTDQRTEGVFYFPLPGDASIAGFGMWIGNELVEADIVEKQRAREIFETILREKRDPGLLEWTEGNIFKARVFPIEAQGEKRIKIVYTQFLPKKNGKYVYHYPLQSEMLRQNPLRQFGLDVIVDDAALGKLICSTHDAKIQQRPGEATVRFAAKNYTPDSDFRLEIETAEKAPAIQFLPHRRADDGYFLLKINAPDIISTASPPAQKHDLLVLVDTSASMNEESRKIQAAFLKVLIESQKSSGGKTTFYAVDVEPVSLPEDDPLGALSKRRSLGWTDWDKIRTFISGQKDKTAVLFVGDQREGTVRRELPGVRAFNVLGAFDPQEAVADLLLDLATQEQSWSDVRVEFDGLEVAAVYPDSIGNIPPGRQAVVLGRYDAETKTAAVPKVVVHYTNQGKEHTKTQEISALPESSQDGDDASFIPRLWARKHLDFLLDQKSGASVRDEIIALSESYHLITPYTSLLVLESDADRERFAVKRRLNMRDGERFFADAREKGHRQTVRNETRRWTAEWERLRWQATRNFRQMGESPVLFPSPGQPARSLLPMSLPTPYYMNSREEFFSFSGGITTASDPFSSRFELSNSMENSLELYEEEPADEPFSDGKMEAFQLAEDAEFDFDSSPRQMDALSSFSGKIRRRLSVSEPSMTGGGMLFKAAPGSRSLGRAVFGGFGGGGGYHWTPPPSGEAMVGELFPGLPASGPVSPLLPVVRKTDRNEDVAKILRSLQYEIPKAGALRINESTETLDPRYPRVTDLTHTLAVYARDRRLVFSDSVDGGQTLNWKNSEEEGVVNLSLGLGRLRKLAANNDTETGLPATIDLSDYSLTIPDYCSVRLEKPEPNRVLLIVGYPSSRMENRFWIDTEKSVLLRAEYTNGDRKTSVVHDEFLEIGGVFYPVKTEEFNSEGRVTRRIRRQLGLLDEEQSQRETDPYASESGELDTVIFLPDPLPGGRKGGELSERCNADLLEIIRLADADRWEPMTPLLDEFARKYAEAPGAAMIRFHLMARSRDRQRLEAILPEWAEKLAEDLRKPADERRAETRWPKTPATVSARLQGDRMLSIWSQNDPTRLRLLETLRPAYDNLKQSFSFSAQSSWKRMYSEALWSLNRREEAIAVLKEIAVENRFDAYARISLASKLKEFQGPDEALRYLEAARTDGTAWTADERNNLRREVIRILDQRGRYTEIIEYTNSWMQQDGKDEPYSDTPSDWHLIALGNGAAPEELDACLKRWISDFVEQLGKAKKADDLTPLTRMRGHSAVKLILDQIWTGQSRVGSTSIDPKTRRLVVDLFLAVQDCPFNLSLPGYSAQQFDDFDPQRKIARRALQRLAADTETLSTERIESLWTVAMFAIPMDADKEIHRKIAETVRNRRDAAEEPSEREKLETLYLRFPEVDAAEFLRDCLSKATEDSERKRLMSKLFETLLAESRGPDRLEDDFRELFELLGRFQEDRPAFSQFLERLSSSFLRRRVAQLRRAEEDKIIELDRREYAAKEHEFSNRARSEFADRLAGEEFSPEVAPLVALKINALRIQLRQDPLATAEEALKWYASAEPAIRAGALGQLLSIASAKDCPESIVRRVFELLEAEVDSTEFRLEARGLLAALLLVRGDGKSLVDRLAQWSDEADGEEGDDEGYRAERAKLLALLGDFQAAIDVYEQLRKSDRLQPEDFRRLAVLHLAVDNEQSESNYRLAMRECYGAMNGHALSQLIRAEMEPFRQYSYRGRNWRGGEKMPMPPALNPDVPLMLGTMMRKNASEGHWEFGSLMTEFYEATKDFRILAACADALPGCEMEGIYRALEGFATMRNEVFEEATVDEILRRTEAIRKTGRSEVGALTTLDRRALELLDFTMSVRAGNVLNAPEEHLRRAEKTLKNAFEIGNWMPGEKVLYAKLLEKFGVLDSGNILLKKQVRDERLRQVDVLWTETSPGRPEQAAERVALGLAYAGIVELDNTNAGSKNDKPVELLYLLLDETSGAEQEERVEGRRFRFVGEETSYTVLDKLVQYLVARQRYGEAEKLILDRIAETESGRKRNGLSANLYYNVYQGAIRNGKAETTLGSGQKLYDAVAGQLIEKLLTVSPEERYNFANALHQINYFAKGTYGNMEKYARLVAFEKRREIQQGVNDHGELFGVLNPMNLLDWGEVFRYHLECFEQEPPQRLRLTERNIWRLHGVHMLDWWRKAKNENVAGLDELEARLLKILLKILRVRMLASDHDRWNFYNVDELFSTHSSRYWKEKETEYLAELDRIYEEYADCAEVVHNVATFLSDKFGDDARTQRRQHVLDILRQADRDGVLGLERRKAFAVRLFDADLFEESLPFWEQLAAIPEQWDVATQYRIRTLGKLKRMDEARKVLAEDEKRFGSSAVLASVCLDAGLYEEAIRYYRLAMPAIDGGPQSNAQRESIYSGLARCYSETGKLAEAVDAACRAVLYADRRGNRRDRNQETGHLRRIFETAKPQALTAYLDAYEKDVETTGLDNPLVRFALGKMYESREEFDAAEKQFLILTELQPNDDEILKALFELASRREDRDAAVRWLLERIRLQPRDPAFYKELGDLFIRQGNATEAERAYTSMAEILPGESEGHEALAKLREEQERYDEAIRQWYCVAEVRSLEPTGLLNVLRLQVEFKKQPEAARSTLKKLRDTKWPERFNDMKNDLDRYQRAIEAR